MGITNREYGRRTGINYSIVVPVSFVTANQGAYYVYFRRSVTIKSIAGAVTGAIGGTDNGTITGANSTGSSSGGVLTATASDAFGTQYAAVSPTTNNTVAAGGYYKLTTAKTTTGGTVNVTLEVETA
jgi:hypothetical protein